MTFARIPVKKPRTADAIFEDFLFFGYTRDPDCRPTWFRLSELENIRSEAGLPVERDLFFQPCSIHKVTKNFEASDSADAVPTPRS